VGFQLVLLACLSPIVCEIVPYGGLHPSEPACHAAVQELASEWVKAHPRYRIMGIVCWEPRPGTEI